MYAKELAERLESAHEVVTGRYMACCPVHDDKTPSLSISDGDKGVLLHCHAGCSTDSVLSSLGLKPSDLFYEKSKLNGNGLCLELPSELQDLVPQSPSGGLLKSVVKANVKYAFVREYVYTDGSGMPVLSVGRYESASKKKTFLQYSREDGGYLSGGLKNRKAPAYKLPSLLERPDSLVYIVEGEMCAEALHEAIGEPVTCWVGGSNAWSNTDWTWVKGREVTLIADEDEPGRKCMRGLVAHLQKLGANVQLLCPPGDTGRDIADVVTGASEDDSRGAMMALAYIQKIQPEPVVESIIPKSAQVKEANEQAKALLTPLTAFEPKQVDWLVEGWLPAKHISLLAGQAGMGKTTLAIDLCARLTRGKDFPDGSRVKQCEVAYWSGEDSLEHTIVPRLLAAGANPKRVHVVNGIEGKQKREFHPATDIASLEAALNDHPSIRVIVLDPVIALIMGARNANAPEEVRKLLEPVRVLTERNNVALLGIHHFLKRHNSIGSNSLDRVIGSQAWGGLARVVWAVDIVEGKRVLARAKNNLGITDGSLPYETVSAFVQTKKNQKIQTSQIEYSQAITGDANSLFGGIENNNGDSPAVVTACEFIEGELAGGRLIWNEIVKRGKDESHTKTTLRRAREKLKDDERVQCHKVGGSGGAWYWELTP